MPNFTILPQSWVKENYRLKPALQSLFVGVALLFGLASQGLAATINVPADQPTIAAAISAAAPGDVILLAAGTYVLSTQISLNKDVTIEGVNKSTTIIQGNISVGTYFILISGAGAGATIKNLTFDKTDKNGEQNIIGFQANNITIENCDFTGEYVLGDPEVSRAFVVSPSITGFLIDGCSIVNLRQPAYFNPNSQGQVLNSFIDQTRGWVVDGGAGSNIVFSGNTFGANAVDIAILVGTALGAPYDPLETLSANNDGAIFSDQRTYKAYNLTQDLSYNSATAIQDAVNAANPGDDIQVKMGTHNETVNVSEEVTITGAGNGSDPNSNTVVKAATACSGTAFTISANNVTLKNMFVKDYINGVQIGAFNNSTIEDLFIEDHCTYGINLAGTLANDVIIKGTTITRTGLPSTSVGIRAGTGNGVDGLLVDGCTITNNYQGIHTAQSGTPSLFTDITIQNSTISNNAIKGMYFEKLNNALLKGLTMNNNGTDVGYGNNAGIDINLKYDDYSNITIEACDITNSGVTGTATDSEAPVSVGIKARDDAPSYNSNPATLTNVVLKNNKITGPQNGIRFGEYGKTNASPTNITLEKNDLGYAFGHKAIISRTAGDIALNCNWHGSTDVPAINGNFVIAHTGDINLNQFLDVNTDGNPAVGFQPSGTCICPSGLLVTNDNTNVTYCSIQEAINAATAGDKLIVSPGTYDENVTINKALILEGANANDACGSRGAESKIAPASGLPFNITANDVTINGFEVTAPTHNNAINCGSASNLTLKFNNIHDIYTTGSGSNAHSIVYTLSSSLGNDRENVNISDNCFDNIGNNDNMSKSASAIGILQSDSKSNLTNLTIERNTIENVTARNAVWNSGGRIAYGISINVGGNGSFLTNGKVLNAIIRDNEIANLEGFISTGIGLEGNTENAIIENNSVTSLKGYKVDTRAGGGYDLSALKFENNRYVSTCTVQNNSFDVSTFTHNVTPGLGYAISNYVTTADGGDATLSCNWMGTAVYNDILDNVGLTGKVFAKSGCVINFVPFLVDGTDNDVPTPGFQPVPTACTGGPVRVYNGSTFVSAHDAIQEAIEAVTTLNGYSIRVASGTYNENVNAAIIPNKNVRILPGNSPGCVTINGNYTLNAGDVLEMEVEGTTACTQYDQFIVNGTVTLNGATLNIPMSMYFAQDGDQIVLIQNDGTDAVVGKFKQGNFVSDGNNQFYIDYNAGTDNNDVVLTKCCGPLVDLGIFPETLAPVDNISPVQDVLAGNKLTIRARPSKDAVYGAYSQGTFTLRTLTSNGVGNFAGDNVHSAFGYQQIGTKQADDGYDYFVFNFEAVPDTADLKLWTAASEHDLLTLTYNCTIAGATFELVNDAFAISIGGEFYQELNGETNPGAQGVFYTASATGPALLAISASSNSPVCETMNIDLNSTTSNGSTPYATYTWSGPDTYMSALANPVPFTALLTSAGIYTVSVTDGNGCTASASTTVLVPATGACVQNETNDPDSYYPTITQAINAAATVNGDVLNVPAGTWAENVVVNKELVINGPKKLVSGCDPTRGTGEAIVVPATAAIASGEIFHVAADNVTIAGFTIDGDNPLIMSGYTSTNGADIDAREGVTVYETGINNLTTKNNIFKNLSYFGVTLYDYPAGVPSSGHEISSNKFQDLGTYDAGSGISLWGGGVLMHNNQYATVKDNCMDNVRIGIQTGNFSQANPGAASYQVIDNNTINARRRGIFHNLHYSTASPLTLSNNDITAVVNGNESVWDGILLSSLSVASTAQDNTIDGTAVSNPSEGYEVWNVKNTFPTTITGGSVTGVGIGLFVNNYEGYSSNAGDGAHATVSGLAITPKTGGTGIRVLDSPSSTHANVQLSIGAGVTVTNGAKGLVVENATASIVGGALNNISFSGQSGNYVELVVNTGNLDGTSALYAGTTGGAKSLTDNFATEDKILHKTDNAALGFVRVKAAEVFVTPNSGSVQRGVDASSTGDIVNVANGTYNEDVLVNKDITVDGESLAAIIRGLYAAGLVHSVHITASNATLKDVKVTRDYGANAAAWYACAKNQGVTIGNSTTGVTLDNVWITGNRNGLYINDAQSFTVQNCLIEDNRTGIQLVNNISNGQIKNNFIRDNFTLGVLYNVFGSNNFIGTNHELNDNDISGNWYAQLAFHQAGGSIGDLTGFDNNCNWYGTIAPDYAAIPAGEPGYGAQLPSQFGGTDPGVTADIRGTKANLLTYIPFLTNGTDNDLMVDGFQAVPMSCNGLGLVTNVTKSLTYPTIQLAIDDANPSGDLITVAAGIFSENVNITKPLTLQGVNYTKAGCDITRAAESIISGGGGTAVTISANGVSVLGFQINGRTAVSSTGYTDIIIKNNKANVQVFGVTSSAMTTSGSDEYTLQDNCIDLLCQAYEAFPFETNPTLSATPAAGAWYVDRYAPAGFVSANFGGGNRLKHSINIADTQGNGFLNTQGRAYDIAGTKEMSIQLYVPAAWASTQKRWAGFWGVGVDGSNVVSDYPILEFSNDGGVPRFRGWDVSIGLWVDMGLPTGFTYDQWYTLNIALVGNNFIYSVGDLELVMPASPTTVSMKSVILQGYNHAPGFTYDIYWDNLNTFCSPSATANTPTVGVVLAAASGTAAATLQGNSVSDAFYGYLLSAVNTTPRTTVTGGTYTNLMQGVAVLNTLDGVTYAPSTVGVDDVTLQSFGGNYPSMPAVNFHSGIYAYTGGSNAAHKIDLLINNVTVKNTGKIAADCAGLYFGDFSTGAGNRLNAEVNLSTIEGNDNRGIFIRGANATATVNTSNILFNGDDPYGLGGNQGFGVKARDGALITLENNFITNPLATTPPYIVYALSESGAASTIVAHNNNIKRNGNGELTSTGSGSMNASCNWWGNSYIDVIDADVDGNVTFIPYLNAGGDVGMNSADGFQPAGTCVNPKRWYVNDNALVGDIYTSAVGNDLNQGTKRRPFLTIGKAINTVVSTDTIYVDAGGYDEQSVVPATKDNLLFQGAGLPTMVDFTGTASSEKTLFRIFGENTTIDGFKFNVDLTKLHMAINASDASLENITIKNNTISPYQSTPGTYFGTYGPRNAISVNLTPPSNFGGVDNVVVDNNIVTATVNGTYLGDLPDAGDIGFRSAVAVDYGSGTFTRNTFQAISHDIIVRYNLNGTTLIGGSALNANTFNGGGVQISGQASAGPVGLGTNEVSYNTFDGSVVGVAATPGSVLRLQNNNRELVTTVKNNTFNNLRWGMSVENYRDITVQDNTFNPLAGYTTFRHITVNTKCLSSNSPLVNLTTISGTYTGNIFNSLTPTVGGTAISFYNHDAPATIGTFTVGGAGALANVFAKDFTYAALMSDKTGNTLDHPDFPEYSTANLGAGSNTTMACWDKDINLSNNTFDVGSGQELPADMTSGERATLETKLYHKPDALCLGSFFPTISVMAKVFLQGPYDPADGRMGDALRVNTLIPTATTPYTQIEADFPGSFVKVNNSVVESITLPGVLDDKGSNSIVDWIWLELRDKDNENTVLFTRSALLQRDGDIVDLDGTSAVSFPNAYEEEYYLMVRHRNHLAAMTAAPVADLNVEDVDFTDPAEATFGTTPTSARRLVKTGIYGLWAGNTYPKSANGFQLKYNGSQNDRAQILNVVGNTTPLNVVTGYYLEDVNMNSQVKYSGSNNDRVIILNNVGASTPLNIITQQPNN